MAIKSSVEKVTPEIATKILEEAKTSVQNRNVSETHVAWLAQQMSSGKWSLNGEAIILDDEGQLIDGQHRLWAVVNSGVTIETVVTRGVDRKGFATIDTGNARTVGNVLSIVGEKNANVLGSVLGWLHRYESGKILWSLRPSGFSSQIAVAMMRKHPGARDACDWAMARRGLPCFKRVPVSPMAFLRYKFHSYKPQKADEFFDLISDVIQDTAGSPTRILRDRYLTRDAVGSGATLEIMAISVKAWTAFLDGTKPQKFTWRRVGQYPENFPPFPGDQVSSGVARRRIPSK